MYEHVCSVKSNAAAGSDLGAAIRLRTCNQGSRTSARNDQLAFRGDCGVVVVVGRGLHKYMYIGSACLMIVDLFVCAAVLLFVISGHHSPC